MRAAIGAIVSLDGGGTPAVDLAVDLEVLAARARLPAAGARRLVSHEQAGLVAVPVRPAAAGAAAGGGEPAGIDVVLDGTIDNRMELGRALGVPPADATAEGGRRLLAAAYRRWGEACPAQLVGEFAFALWDRDARRLFAACDSFGQRELFYAADGRQVRLASQLQMLVARPGLTAVDEEFAADFLAGIRGHGASTPFRQVRRLQAGHGLSVGGGRVTIRRWWCPGEDARRPGRSEGETVEEFRMLLAEGVACCLATGGRVWAELSGGLDSSSIVCLAQEVLRREPARARDFATLTYAWQDAPQCDERRWSDAVVARCAVANHVVFCDGLFFADMAAECGYRSEPHFGLLAHPLLRKVGGLLREAGVEVLLSGARAESVVLADQMAPVQLADSLRGLRWRELGGQLLRWQRGTHLPLANLLLAYGVRPLFGRRYPRSILDRGEMSPWVDRRFAARMKVRQRSREARVERRFRSFAQQHQYEMLVRSAQSIARGSLEWSCEIRHPFLHRPLVELALAIPWEQKVAPEEGKLLLRRAMAGRLPEEVRRRQAGGGPSADLYKSFARCWPAIESVIGSSVLVEMGLVDGVEFRRAAELARFGGLERFVGFLSCLAFEYWLRAVALGVGAGGAHGPAVGGGARRAEALPEAALQAAAREDR